MFNKTILVQGRTEHVPYEKTIIEKKAPTDESIKLYEEIKEKAYKSIVDTISLKDNLFNFNAIFYEDNYNFERVCKYKFSLNGREIEGKISNSELDFARKDMIIESILKKLADHIAFNLLKSLQGDILKSLK